MAYYLSYFFFLSGFRSQSSNMQREVAIQTVQTEHGDQQGADAEIWCRKLVQVSFNDHFTLYLPFLQSWLQPRLSFKRTKTLFPAIITIL